MKPIAHIRTYTSDCTSTGHDVWLYPDGHIAIENQTSWQGSRNGMRWITEPDFVDVSEIDETDPDHDAEAVLTALWDRLEPDFDRDHDCDCDSNSRFRKVRVGYLVR